MRKPALGAIYLVNRYYDPTTAQFVSVDPDLAQTDQAYVYVTDDPVNGIDPTGLYRQIRRIAWTTVDGVYAALNQVSTGRSANVQPGMVRIQFQISARSFVQKIAMDKISASISNDSLGGAPAYDSTNPPIRLNTPLIPRCLHGRETRYPRMGYLSGSSFLSQLRRSHLSVIHTRPLLHSPGSRRLAQIVSVALRLS